MTTTWVLILSLLGDGQTAITSVPGFQSRSECLSAANAWIDQMDDMRRYSGVLRVPRKALCVSQSIRGEGQ